MAATDAQMVTSLKEFLQSGAGVTSITVDGVTTTLDRKQAMEELSFWERRAARTAGTRPVASRIKLDAF